MKKGSQIYILTIFVLLSLYMLVKYCASYYILNSVRSFLGGDAKNIVYFRNINFEPIGLNLKIKGLNSNNKYQDEIFVDFSWSNIFKNQKKVYFKLDYFDLKFLRNTKINDFVNLSKANGLASGEGSVVLNGDDFEIDLNIRLRNLFLYSRDLKIINYFAKEIDFRSLSIKGVNSSFKIQSPFLNIQNLIFSIPSKDFDYDKLSKFSKIEIDRVDISGDYKKGLTKGVVEFSDGGFFAFNGYGSDNKSVLDLKSKGIDLIYFSESLESLLNYQIKSGKMNLDSRIETDKKNIKADFKVVLKHFGLDNKNEFGKKLQKQSLIPLRTALFFVKDDDGDIELDFEVYGDKNDPNFGLLNVLNRGAGSIAISKVSSIIATKVATQLAPMLVSSIPISPSNMFSFVNGAYKIATKARFKDVKFIKLSPNISDDSKNDLKKVVDFLKKNSGASLHICPVASTVEFGDKDVEGNKVLSLADDRLDSLNDYFKKHGGGGVLNQIIFCRPKISSDSDIATSELSI